MPKLRYHRNTPPNKAAELRNDIWRLAVVGTVTACVRKPHIRTPGILRVCQQARQEALGIWLLESRFWNTVMGFNAAFVHFVTVPDFYKILESAIRMGVLTADSVANIDRSTDYRGIPGWSNLLNSLRAFHQHGANTLDGPGRKGPLHCLSPALKITWAAYGMVSKMRDLDWGVVEEALEGWHEVIVDLDDESYWLWNERTADRGVICTSEARSCVHGSFRLERDIGVDWEDVRGR
ncbi:hypothetical protein LTR53_014753 [Teratosphaeriaceae sp. CCFEE 6253]|nr:hypothetical protein LTR53_014753 [Teratosphaeriaceae sp. CCFEE 6253]